jgi:homoserine kinase
LNRQINPVPGFDRIKSECKDAGAIGGGISGSGPSIFMLSRDEPTAKTVAAVMKSIYDRIGVLYHIYVTTINRRGVSIKA